MLLDPKTAAQISKVLFPGEDPAPALVKLIQWFDEYVEARNNNASSIPGYRRPHFPETPKSESEPESESKPVVEYEDSFRLNNRSSTQMLQQMMHDLLIYAKTNKLSASDLAREIGASYPTILNWQHGKLPRGENIGKIQAFLDKVRAT